MGYLDMWHPKRWRPSTAFKIGFLTGVIITTIITMLNTIIPLDTIIGGLT